MAVSLQSDEEILTFWESHGKEAGNVILLDDILSLVKADECADTLYQATSIPPPTKKLKSELSSMSARVMSDGEDDVPATSTTSMYNVMKEVNPSTYPYNSVGAILIKCETYKFLCSAFIIDDNTLMTAAHAFDLSDGNCVFVPAMINGTKPLENGNARYDYFAVDHETITNHPDHKPLEDDIKKQILQVVKDQVSKSKMKAIESAVPHGYILNPSVDICTVKVGKETLSATFKDAGLKPIPVESLDPTSDESYPCKIIGYCRRAHDVASFPQSITMHVIEGKGHVDGGNSHLFMNKVSKH